MLKRIIGARWKTPWNLIRHFHKTEVQGSSVIVSKSLPPSWPPKRILVRPFLTQIKPPERDVSKSLCTRWWRFKSVPLSLSDFLRFVLNWLQFVIYATQSALNEYDRRLNSRWYCLTPLVQDRKRRFTYIWKLDSVFYSISVLHFVYPIKVDHDFRAPFPKEPLFLNAKRPESPREREKVRYDSDSSLG